MAMSQVFSNLNVGLDEVLSEKLKLMVDDYVTHRILKKSVDARRSRSPHFIYSVEVFSTGEKVPEKNIVLEKLSTKTSSKPIIIGAGPAGLFAAIRLIERGISCTLLERGSDAVKRLRAINRFWRYGEFQAENNVCFGEGGAGLYSDGKLITRIKSEHIPYVLNRLVRFGAPAEIEYLSNPHVGSDRIRRVIPKIREFLIANGCDIHFDAKVTDLITDLNFENRQVTGVQLEDGRSFHSEHVVLATGHSAEDVFDVLKKHEVHLEGKSFALGLRIEHPQKLINKLQYREAAEHPALGSANYKLTHHDKSSGIGVYSFCMCPGGYTISSGTAANGVVSNGMSNYHRNSPFANSAVVVTLDHEKWFAGDKEKGQFAGLNFRSMLEKKAYQAVQSAGGSHQIPAQRLKDFIGKKAGEVVKSSSPSGVAPVQLEEILPEELFEPLVLALEQFEKKMPGFIGDEAQFHGIESRTSCPLRVTRDSSTLESISHAGLYPTGEGAGYAGGITSAAVDGVKVAEAIISKISVEL